MINLSNLLTGKLDKTLNGISSYVMNKAENLTSGFVRNFTLSNDQKLTFINDVYINLCFNLGDKNNTSVPTHNLDNNSIIAETVRKEPTIWSLECKLTSINHVEEYEKLLKMMENGELITLLFGGRVVENLIITNINRNITNIHYTDFSITLSKLKFVKVSLIPAPTFKKVTSKPVENNTGKLETERNIKDLKPDDIDGIAGAAPIKVVNPFGK